MKLNFRKELISGVIYTGIGKYSSLLISLIITAILARLLSPNDFGIIAIATVIITFFNLISEIGIAPAIVQYKELSKEDISNIFSLTVYIGLIISILFYYLSPYIAYFYNNSTLANMLQWLSINLFFATLNIVPNSMFYRDKKFKFISIRTFCIQLIVGIISIIAALYGLGVYSLIISPIMSSLMIFIISYKYYPQKFQLLININPIKKIFNFSIFQFLYNIIGYLTRNLDKILIGKYLDMNSLGYYEKSYRLMMLPLSNISNVINPVLHPIFSDYQNQVDEMENKYTKLIVFLGYIGIYISIVLYFCSENIILIIYGDQWINSIDVFKILALSIPLQMIMSPCGAIYQATNSTKIMFYFSVISIFTTILGFILSIIIWKSTIAIAYSFTLSVIINCIIGYYTIYKFIFKKKFAIFIRNFSHPIILYILLFITLLIYNKYLHINNIYISLIAIATFTLLFEISYIHHFKIYEIKNLKRYIIK